MLSIPATNLPVQTYVRSFVCGAESLFTLLDMSCYLHPRVGSYSVSLATFVRQRVNLTTSTRYGFALDCNVTALLKLAEHRVYRALCRGAAPVSSAFDFASDFVAVHGAVVQHAQNEELGQAHFDYAVPVHSICVINHRFGCFCRFCCRFGHGCDSTQWLSVRQKLTAQNMAFRRLRIKMPTNTLKVNVLIHTMH